MNYKIYDAHVYCFQDGSEKKLSKNDVLNLMDELSLALPEVNFYSGLSYADICARIYVPSDNARLRPRLQFIAIDHDVYDEHILEDLSDDYLIQDNVLLVFDNQQIERIKTIFGSFKNGPILYSELSELYKNTPEFVEFVRDDTQCAPPIVYTTDCTSTGIELYSYQKQGVSWMNSVIEESAGCVLADEMGLGKTLQIIMVLGQQHYKGTSLVICPNSLQENWVREFKKFAPELKIKVHRGSKRIVYYKDFNKYDVIIMSYDIAVRDDAIIGMNEWNIIVLDEAQAIKNDSKRSKVIREFPKKSGIAVSGTPFENRITDVWYIFDFCYRSLLGERSSFKRLFKDDVESAENLEKIISPLLLRRLVSNVKDDLPNKVIIEDTITMSDKEIEAYEALRNITPDSQSGKLALLTKLRQFCTLPSLVYENLKCLFPEDYSEKFNYLISILDDIYYRKEKVIIFTPFLYAQSVICDTCRERYNTFAAIINGELKSDDRLDCIDEFSSVPGFAVLILNPNVAGVGLNITAANHVVFYTLDWNPALEDQCIGRVCRIGQENKVFVHRLYYANTVEEVVNDRINAKRALADVLIHGTADEDAADINRALQMSPFIGGECL